MQVITALSTNMYIAILRWLVVIVFLMFSLIFLLATIFGAFEKPYIGMLSSIGCGVVSAILVDQFRGRWMEKYSAEIENKKRFWFGVVLMLATPIGMYNIVDKHILEGSSDFTAESGASKSAWLGELYNYLAVVFGVWLPITINIMFGVVMLLIGLKLVLSRFGKNT